jgi:hypothetical protein
MLWRGLTTDGIWQKILKYKYMPLSSVSNWFRLESKCTETLSHGWKNLQKEKYLLDHWLCWKVGNGTAIQEGMNHLMGLGARSILTLGLLSTLNSRGSISYHN